MAALPGVGRNLQDHPLVGAINYETKGALPPPRNNGAESTLWWKSDPNLMSPDLQPVILEFPFATPELGGALPPNCYAIAPSLVRPAARGSVTLTSADPRADLAIDMNYLGRGADVEALLFAIDLCREIGAAPALAGFRKREVMPGPLSRADMLRCLHHADGDVRQHQRPDRHDRRKGGGDDFSGRLRVTPTRRAMMRSDRIPRRMRRDCCRCSDKMRRPVPGTSGS